MRDYKKVQIQLENLETSVRDRCKKEFTGKIQCYVLLSQNQISSVLCAEVKKKEIHKVSFCAIPLISFRPDDRDDGHVQWSGGFRDPFPGLPGVRRANFLPRPPGVTAETRPGCSWESKADCGAGAGSAVQPAQQQTLPHQGQPIDHQVINERLVEGMRIVCGCAEELHRHHCHCHCHCCPCSSFTLWRSNGRSPQGTGPMWPLCSLWPCTVNWSTSQTSWRHCLMI